MNKNKIITAIFFIVLFNLDLQAQFIIGANAGIVKSLGKPSITINNPPGYSGGVTMEYHFPNNITIGVLGNYIRFDKEYGKFPFSDVSWTSSVSMIRFGIMGKYYVPIKNNLTPYVTMDILGYYYKGILDFDKPITTSIGSNISSTQDVLIEGYVGTAIGLGILYPVSSNISCDFNIKFDSMIISEDDWSFFRFLTPNIAVYYVFGQSKKNGNR